jgi:hypothetical protein
MFLEKHDFNQGRVGNGFYMIHGYENEEEDFIPLSKLVVGSRLREKNPLPQVGALSINRLLKQSFVGNQCWETGDIQVPVKRFMESITKFIAQYEEHLDVFAGIYENKLTSTNVLGIYITLKDIDDDTKRLSWEITIDDNDLVEAMTLQNLFRK